MAKKTTEGEQPNHVLLFTVLNPTYPLNCDTLNTIASPFGKLLRVVIFRKNGVQAMLEFDSLDSARRVKENLHGCDIYSGCCTLKIEFAKPTKLNVYKNDADSHDFTNPSLGKNSDTGQVVTSLNSQRPVLLKDPLINQAVLEQTRGTAHHVLEQSGTVTPLSVSIRQPAAGQLFSPAALQHCTAVPAPPLSVASLLAHRLPSPGSLQPQPAPACSSVSPASSISSTSSGSAAGSGSGSSVSMVYGINCDKMNCSRMFNLFCLYGNVVRVKYLKTKEGCAMVQMGDSLAVERVIANLNNVTFFDSKMQLGFSKQAFLADVQQPYELPDGSASFMDFMGNKNNRFINPEMAAKNRIQPPSKILHFFNTPPGLQAADVEEIFMSHGTTRPKCVKMFPSKTDRSSSGLIEFETLSEAVESLVIANHLPVENPSGKFPYIMKLCFSSSKAIPAVIH